MELTIVDRTAPKIHTAFGISEERADEISIGLNNVITNLDNKYTCDVMKDIASICDTPEELVYAILNHVNFISAMRDNLNYRSILS